MLLFFLGFGAEQEQRARHPPDRGALSITTWPDLEVASPSLRVLLRRIDHPQTGPRRRRKLCQQALRRVRRNERPRLCRPPDRARQRLDGRPGGRSGGEERTRDPGLSAASEITPRSRGAALANLGFCFTFRPRGDPGKNVEIAIVYDQEALKVLASADDAELWGSVLHRLAANFLERSTGDQNHKLEPARRLFQEALRVRTFENDPLDWAATRNGLTAVDTQRVRGDRMDNQERAVAGFLDVLGVFTRESFPERWARDLGEPGEPLCGASLRRSDREPGKGHRRLSAGPGGLHPERGARTLGANEDRHRLAQRNLGHLVVHGPPLEGGVEHLRRGLAGESPCQPGTPGTGGRAVGRIDASPLARSLSRTPYRVYWCHRRSPDYGEPLMSNHHPAPEPLLDETAYLFRSPANRERLLKATENVALGRNLVIVDLGSHRETEPSTR